MSNPVISFDEWVTEFKRQRESKKAFEALEELSKYGEENEFLYLKHRVTMLCYEAIVFDQIIKNDDLKLKRAFSRRREEATRAIRIIKDFIDDYPHEAGENFGIACDRYRIKVFGDQPKDWMSHSFYKYPLSGVFEEYMQLLQQQMPLSIMGNGVFIYDSPINSRTNLPDNSAMSLIFLLVILFRDWTELGDAKVPFSSLLCSRKVPNYGKPCNHIVAIFVNAVFNKRFKAEHINDKVNKHIANNKNLEITNFPIIWDTKDGESPYKI